MYEVYTLPNCESCHKAVELMKQRNIAFEQINTGDSDGMKKFRDFYAKHREQITRDSQGVVLPVLAYQDNGKVRIHQGIKELEKFLGIE